MPYATYRFNKIIAAETIRFIVTVAIVVYKGLKLVVYRMLTFTECLQKRKRLEIKNIHYKPSVFCKETIPLSGKRQPVVNINVESPSGENII